MNESPIYLDYNSTTPCDPAVVAEMMPYFTTKFGNASSKTHVYGWTADEAVEEAREKVAQLIGAKKTELIFTSGATESINLALRGLYESSSQKGRHVITYSTEHKAVLDTCRFLETLGAEMTILPVDNLGNPDLELLESAIRKDTIFIAAMYANNETGTVMPIKSMASIARKNGVLFFCDATQAIGKIPVDVVQDGIDMMAFSAHKMYGPKGVGALYIAKKDPKIKISPMQYGGGHERNLRSGTLNVPGIVGFGKACELAELTMEKESFRLTRLRDMLLDGISSVENIVLNGSKSNIMGHVANLSFGFPGGEGMIKILTKNMAVSSGSACSSASIEPSHVLQAMGLNDTQALSSIRFSLGRFTTEDEIVKAIKCINEECRKMKNGEK